MSAFEQYQLSFGLRGTRTINATDGLVSGNFYAITALGDVVVNSIGLAEGHTGQARWAGLTLFAGSQTVVRFNSITLTSGTAIVYEVE